MPKPIFVFDFETTGVNVNTLTPLEIGYAVIEITNGVVKVLEEPVQLMFDVDPDTVGWELGAYELSQKTGILEDLKRGTIKKYSHMEVKVNLRRLITKYGHMVMGGSGVGEFDRQILKRFFPDFEKELQYRSADLGNFRKVLDVIGYKTPYDEYPFGGFTGAHRAKDDVKAFIDQYKYFAEKIKLEV